MVKSIVAVVVGVIGWGLVFNGFYLGLVMVRSGTFSDDGSTSDAVNLVALLVWSAVASVAMGWIAATISGSKKAVLALGIVNLVIGIGVQATSWELYPVWYHIPFLALVLPLTVLGGRMGKA